MAQIRIDLAEPLLDGMDVKFAAPCNCSAVTGLVIFYPTEDESTAFKNFTFRDSHGNDLTGLGDLFSEGSYVKVIVDVNNEYAYLQNADTNGYIEAKIGGIETEVADVKSKIGTGPKFYFGESEPTDWSDGDIWLKPIEE